MGNLLPLMEREWLQHRFAWTLLVLVPLTLAVLGLGVGTIQLDDEVAAMAPPQLGLMVTTITFGISCVALLLLLGVTSLFIALGSPRRDDSDRSTEFWLSLPSGHAESLAAPMLVHLLLVPMAAVGIGLLVALPVSLVVVGRVVGIGEWFGLPWGHLLAAGASVALRVAAGVPLAVLWLLPLVLAAMLANALVRRWGLPLLAVTLGLVAWVLERVFGQPLLWESLGHLGLMAARSLAGASAGSARLDATEGVSPEAVLAHIPGLAAADFGAALAQLAQPSFLGSLLVSALLFALLVQWRRRAAVGG